MSLLNALWHAASTVTLLMSPKTFNRLEKIAMNIAFKPGKLRVLLAVGALAAAAAAQAASGYIVTPQQEKGIRVGMTRDEVRASLGRPAHNLKYRSEPGRTWTYGVAGSDTKVFEIDFSADGKVSSTHEVEEPVN